MRTSIRFRVLQSSSSGLVQDYILSRLINHSLDRRHPMLGCSKVLNVWGGAKCRRTNYLGMTRWVTHLQLPISSSSLHLDPFKLLSKTFEIFKLLAIRIFIHKLEMLGLWYLVGSLWYSVLKILFYFQSLNLHLDNVFIFIINLGS